MKNLAKKVFAIIIITILFFMQFNIIALHNKVKANTNEKAVISEKNHYKYFYSQLSEDAKKIYDAMVEMYETEKLKTGNANYDLVEKGKVSESLVEAYKKGDNSLIIAFESARDAFYLDYPEIFYINFEKYSIRITVDANKKSHVWLGTGSNDNYYLTGFSNLESVNNAETEYENALNTIINGAKALSENYEGEDLIVKQIKYVHDEVDKSAIYKLDDVCKKTNLGHIRTPYGALVAKEAVCEGYSKTIKVALDKLEIPCILVRGVYKWGSNETERHMWNMVKIQEKWYGIDATFDDNEKVNEMGIVEISEEYLLTGESKMSLGHYPEGIMSAPEFEFIYPDLEYDTYGVREIANINGLEIKYKAVPYEGNTYAALDISYKGLNFENAAKEGYHFLTRYYSELNKPDKSWSYIDTKIYPSIIKDGTNSFEFSIYSIPYIEIAVVDIPIDNRAYSEDFNESVKYQRFQGDESMFLASSGILGMPDAKYVAPPRFTSASPYVDTKLKADKVTHIKLTYNEDLEKTSENVIPNCYITTKNAWTTSAVENSKISNFSWDGKRTIQLDFAPSSQWGDNSVIYYLNINGLVGKNTKKIPTPAHYYVQNTFGCTYSMAKSNVWRIYGRPTLIEDGTTNVEGWTLSDGKKITKEESENFKNITDRLALVVDKVSLDEENKMNTLVESENTSKILSSETYNINLILCNKKVLSTANNDKVTVYLGFPQGYGPNDVGVTFKAYHFKTKNGSSEEVEEIPCVITPYGLLVTCNAFSPFQVVAMEKSETDLEKKEKSIFITSDLNGFVENLENNIITLNPEESKTYVIRANEGYQIESLKVLGEEIVEATGKEFYEIQINYEDIENINNFITTSFVAKTVVQQEMSREENIVVPTIEQAKIIEMPEEVISNIGENAVISPEIVASNGIDTYQWYKDGKKMLGQTNDTLKIENITTEDEGIYTLVITSILNNISKKETSTECKILTSDFEVVLETSKQTIAPGEIFEVKAYLRNLRNLKSGLIALAGQLEFDTSSLEIYKENENQNALLGEEGWNLNAFNDNNFKFIADNENYISENTHIFTLYFKAKDNIVPEKELQIVLKDVSASGGKGVVLPVSNADLTIKIIEDVDVFVPNNYRIDEEQKIVYRIVPGTTVLDFMKNIETNRELEFINKDNKVLKDSDVLSTGGKIKVGKKLEYTIVVTGDIDGDGKLSINDLAKLKLHFINSEILSGYNLLAGDIDGVGEITINDIAQLKLALIDKFKIK